MCLLGGAILPRYVVSLGESLRVRWNKFRKPPVRRPRFPRGDNTDKVDFYSLTKARMNSTPSTSCFASLGWPVTATKEDYEKRESSFSMLHPSTDAEIQLPILPPIPLKNIWKLALSSDPCSTSDYILMFQTVANLGYCRPGLGQQGWTKLNLEGENFIRDLTYYQGSFYIVDQSGRVSAACDIEDPERAHLRVVAPEIPNKEELLGPMKGINHLYLVESEGSLLVVLCISYLGDHQSTIGCRVFKVPFSSGCSWSDSEVKNLGNRALLVGKGTSSFSVEVSGNSRCKANCIYFMNCRTYSPLLEPDVGNFHMESRTIDRDFRNSFNTRFQDIESLLWMQHTLILR